MLHLSARPEVRRRPGADPGRRRHPGGDLPIPRLSRGA